jgi:polyvinyl alcohol dehydrogenase (cytochrome)
MKNRNVSLPMMALIGVLLLVPALSAQSTQSASSSAQWAIAGQNLDNSRSQPAEHTISPANVKGLIPKWVFTTTNDVSATPTVYGGAVYFPDWGGNLFAVNAESGSLIWSHQISDYDGATGAFSRVSPAVDVEDDQLIVGDIINGVTGAIRADPAGSHNQAIIGDILNSMKLSQGGANVIAINRETGTLRWITNVSSHPAAIITGSPVVFEGVVYIGVSSSEEAFASSLSYPCCTFRGSIVALDAKSGKILWQTFTVPDNGGLTGGYSGGAVWQPPAIDSKRGLLFVGSGDNYSAPAGVEACQNAHPKTQCTAADDYFDTALALDLKTGNIKWAKRVQDVDTFTAACFDSPVPNQNCEVPGSPDFDFGGSGPNLVSNIVGFGQKSGIYWALNPDNGNLVWRTQVGPGGDEGGMEWGTATDGKHIYAAISDVYSIAYILVPSGQQITWGSWSALDVATGKILWQTADPTTGTHDFGAVSVANGVMYASSFAGQTYALDTTTGTILWSFASGGSVIDGPSIVDGTVYWGSGYRSGPGGTGNNKVYAFALAGSTNVAENSKGGQK